MDARMRRLDVRKHAPAAPARIRRQLPDAEIPRTELHPQIPDGFPDDLRPDAPRDGDLQRSHPRQQRHGDVADRNGPASVAGRGHREDRRRRVRHRLASAAVGIAGVDHVLERRAPVSVRTGIRVAAGERQGDGIGEADIDRTPAQRIGPGHEKLGVVGQSVPVRIRRIRIRAVHEDLVLGRDAVVVRIKVVRARRIQTRPVKRRGVTAEPREHAPAPRVADADDEVRDRLVGEARQIVAEYDVTVLM